jgi:Fe-S-cluster containining protein
MSESAALQATAAEWEAEFARQKGRYGSKIQCRLGCTDCCHHLFRITEIEAAYISKGIKGLETDARLRLEERARRYHRERERLLTDNAVPDAWGTLPPPGMRLACPALEDGACQIYTHRPLVCRKYGIPLYHPQKPSRLFACELNFKPGEEIEDSQLVQIQTSIHDRWAEVQAEFNRRGGSRDPKPITVARAILEDLEPYLPL